jgi:hypothetical protein
MLAETAVHFRIRAKHRPRMAPSRSSRKMLFKQKISAGFRLACQ